MTMRGAFCAMLGLVCGLASVVAGGQAEQAPVIRMEEQPRQFIAPGNSEAVVHSLQLPFSTIAFTAKGQVIKSWTFKVFDSTGKQVFQDSRLETRDRGFFGELFNLGPRPQVEIPKDLTWDGTFKVKDTNLDGKLVPDGNYTYQISIVDSAGGRAQTPPFNVTVKNAAMVINTIRIPQTIFSPVGERKTIRVEQDTSREKHWEGTFSDTTGRPVRTIVWENPSDDPSKDIPAPSFEWDGRDDHGTVLPDGAYAYALVGRNRPGAAVQKRFLGTIAIDSRASLVRLAADNGVVSPNDDGILDVLTLTAKVGEGAHPVTWSLQAYDTQKPAVVVWSRRGKAPVPDKLTFDGKTAAGTVLPDGHYQAVFSTVYDNGETAQSAPVSFDLSVARPPIKISADYTVFGGNGRAGVTLSIQGELGVDLTMQVVDPSGKPARSYPLGSSGTASVEFQGLDEKGKALPDGPYTVKVSGRNRAGTEGVAVLQLTKDSRATTASLEQTRPVLVPNRVPQGSVRFTPVLSVVDSIAHTTFTVSGADGKVWLTKEAASIIPFWDWDGKDDYGKTLPDAPYTVGIQVTYDNGAVAKATANLAIDSTALDNKAPQLDLTLSAPSFSPVNIDGPQVLTIGMMAVPGADPIDHWKVLIADPRGKPFYSAFGTGTPPAKLVWNGKSDKGVYVESGEDYQISATVADTKGRTSSKEATVTADILVEKLGEGRYKIVISSIQFAGYSSDIFKVQPELLPKNMAVLRKLASVLNKFPEYKIRLEGYAVSELWNDPKSAAEEQRNELVPLSLDRADEVKSGLVLLGVSAGRFMVKGRGSERPLVPNSDLENRWKNRRVEFYLDRA